MPRRGRWSAQLREIRTRYGLSADALLEKTDHVTHPDAPRTRAQVYAMERGTSGTTPPALLSAIETAVSHLPVRAFHRPGGIHWLDKARPDLAAEWDTERNPTAPTQHTVTSRVEVWWVCRDDPEHRWRSTILKRTRSNYPQGCPKCRQAARRSSPTCSTRRHRTRGLESRGR